MSRLASVKARRTRLPLRMGGRWTRTPPLLAPALIPPPLLRTLHAAPS